ncbi:MAG TPA: hypothetical protein VLF71_05900 [Candidatus Saccharimonadales bacterium]|nr:hypothetical protein [Candidatus Saccharimonadales bacterium]
MDKPLQSLLQKEMTRKEFLATIGLGVASILGFSSLLKLLGLRGSASQSHGYGSHGYGR